MRKPKLLFLRYRYGENLPEFVRLHREQQAKCLGQFFEVRVVQQDCDYLRLCDEHEPDLVMLELLGGGDIISAVKLKIDNLSRNSRVPKVVFLNADSWCEARPGFLSDIEQWQPAAVFSICSTAAQHLPSSVGPVFVWPHSVDTQVFRDYGERKVIPVFLTGATSSIYPWRSKVNQLLAKSYPILSSPHFGYTVRSAAAQMLYGEPYARVINASWFVPTCGTVAKEVLRKHFEIPACRSCLVSEPTTSLRAAGFIDMHNCVLAKEQDVPDKIADLLKEPERVNLITARGHELIKSAHTSAHRDQILQWFTLSQSQQPGQIIEQRNPFGGLSLTSNPQQHAGVEILLESRHLRLLDEAKTALTAGEHARAEELYRQVTEFIIGMPEAQFGLAVCALHQGRPKEALRRLVDLNQYILSEYHASEPDPMEWAFLIVALLCCGRVRSAAKRAFQFGEIAHPALDAVRGFLGTIRGDGLSANWMNSFNRRRARKSLHDLPCLQQDIGKRVAKMLTACNKRDFATRLAARCETIQKKGAEGAVHFSGFRKTTSRRGVKRATLRRFDNPLLFSRAVDRAKKVAAKIRGIRSYISVHSRSRLAGSVDCFVKAVCVAAAEQNVSKPLIVTLSQNDPRLDALMTELKLRLNTMPLRVTISSDASGKAEILARMKWAVSAQPTGYAMRSSFDLLGVFGPGIPMWPELADLALHTKITFIDDIDSPSNAVLLDALAANPDYRLTTHVTDARGGYAVFQRGHVTSLKKPTSVGELYNPTA